MRALSQISIHALLAESDIINAYLAVLCTNFYPRSPCGERRKQGRHYIGCKIFLSTLSLRRATPSGKMHYMGVFISIHALQTCQAENQSPFLSTLSLRRATARLLILMLMRSIFLSTLSLRRATAYTLQGLQQMLHFYPRSPCGERRKQGRHYIGCKIFLSTLSLRRATCWNGIQEGLPLYFYPRSPCGERLA